MQTLRDPTRASVLASIEAICVSTPDEVAASIRRVGITVEPDGAQPQPSLPVQDALIVFFHAGYGFRAGADRFLAVSDTEFDTARPGLVTEPGETAVSVDDLERVLRGAGAASVVILDTNII